MRACQLPEDTQFDYSWTLRKVHIGENVDHVAYSSSSETYVLGTSHKAEFKLPEDDELHTEWRNEGQSRTTRIVRNKLMHPSYLVSTRGRSKFAQSRQSKNMVCH